MITPQLSKGINLDLDLESKAKAEDDGELDISLSIKPNNFFKKIRSWYNENISKTNTEKVNAKINELKAQYQNVLTETGDAKDERGNLIPKYQSLINELETIDKLRGEKAKMELLDKIEKQIKIADKILEYRETYKGLSDDGEFKDNRVVIYGTYDLLISPKDSESSNEPKKLKGEYNAASSQGTRQIEESYNNSGNNDLMIPTQNAFLRYFLIDQSMVRKARKGNIGIGDKFPNPTHDAEAKLYEYLARQIIAKVNGEKSQGTNNTPREQTLIKDANKMTYKNPHLRITEMKDEIKTIEENIQKIEKSENNHIIALNKLINRNPNAHSVVGVNIVDKSNLKDVLIKLNKVGVKALKKDDQDVFKAEKKAMSYAYQIDKNRTELKDSNVKLKEMKKEYQTFIKKNDLADDKIWFDDSEEVESVLSRSGELNEENNLILDKILEDWIVTGKIIINDEQAACNSCNAMMHRFIKRFGEDNVTVDVNAVVGHYYGNTNKR